MSAREQRASQADHPSPVARPPLALQPVTQPLACAQRHRDAPEQLAVARWYLKPPPATVAEQRRSCVSPAAHVMLSSSPCASVAHDVAPGAPAANPSCWHTICSGDGIPIGCLRPQTQARDCIRPLALLLLAVSKGTSFTWQPSPHASSPGPNPKRTFASAAPQVLPASVPPLCESWSAQTYLQVSAASEYVMTQPPSPRITLPSASWQGDWAPMGRARVGAWLMLHFYTHGTPASREQAAGIGRDRGRWPLSSWRAIIQDRRRRNNARTGAEAVDGGAVACDGRIGGRQVAARAQPRRAGRAAHAEDGGLRLVEHGDVHARGAAAGEARALAGRLGPRAIGGRGRGGGAAASRLGGRPGARVGASAKAFHTSIRTQAHKRQPTLTPQCVRARTEAAASSQERLNVWPGSAASAHTAAQPPASSTSTKP